jgi:ParB family chromosome partitioning protein
MTVKKRGLGRGLDALLAPGRSQVEVGETIEDLTLDALVPGPYQPRRHFDPEALRALSDSIRTQGVVQPIVVRKSDGGQYQIVAGERRWRAAELAGLKTIPAIVRHLDERTAMTVALVENIQRTDLNPLEEAGALQRLVQECHLTHEQVADAVGRSRVSVSHLLRLLELPAAVQALVREGKLSFGHAKVLLGASREDQERLAALVVDRHLSVRQTEELLSPVRATPPRAAGRRDSAAEAQLRQLLGLAVTVQKDQAGGGRLVIRFSQDTELQEVLRRLQQATA